MNIVMHFPKDEYYDEKSCKTCRLNMGGLCVPARRYVSLKMFSEQKRPEWCPMKAEVVPHRFARAMNRDDDLRLGDNKMRWIRNDLSDTIRLWLSQNMQVQNNTVSVLPDAEEYYVIIPELHPISDDELNQFRKIKKMVWMDLNDNEQDLL